MCIIQSKIKSGMVNSHIIKLFIGHNYLQRNNKHKIGYLKFSHKLYRMNYLLQIE